MASPLRFIATAVLVVSTACTAPPQNSPHHYRDLGAGFEVDYPNGWKVGPGIGRGEFLFSASDTPGAPHCWVNAERVDPAWMGTEQPTLDTFSIHLYVIKRHREAQHTELLSDRRAPVAGHPARHFSARFSAPLTEAPSGGPPRPVTRFQTEVSVTYAHNRPFVLGCTAPVNQSAGLSTSTELLRGSFRPMP